MDLLVRLKKLLNFVPPGYPDHDPDTGTSSYYGTMNLLKPYGEPTTAVNLVCEQSSLLVLVARIGRFLVPIPDPPIIWTYSICKSHSL